MKALNAEISQNCVSNKGEKKLIKKDSRTNLLKSALGIASMIQNKKGGLSNKGNAELKKNSKKQFDLENNK